MFDVNSCKHVCLQIKRVANYETYVDELLAEGAACVSATEHSRLMTEIRRIRQVSLHTPKTLSGVGSYIKLITFRPTHLYL